MNSGRQQTHVARQANQVHAVLAQAGEHIGIVLGAGAALGNEDGVVAVPVRGQRPGRVLGHIGDDDRDLDARQPAVANGLGDGEEVRSAAGKKDAEAKGLRFALRCGCFRAHVYCTRRSPLTTRPIT